MRADPRPAARGGHGAKDDGVRPGPRPRAGPEAALEPAVSAGPYRIYALLAAEPDPMVVGVLGVDERPVAVPKTCTAWGPRRAQRPRSGGNGWPPPDAVPDSDLA